MKKIFTILLVLAVTVTYAQNNPKPKFEKQGDLVEATFYHENGQVEQMGTFNKQNKLHGTWTSYDNKGNKVAIGKYENGKKVGKWFFWTADSLKEVDYQDNAIANVSEWENKSTIAIAD